jgi:hypothetical protein
LANSNDPTSALASASGIGSANSSSAHKKALTFGENEIFET